MLFKYREINSEGRSKFSVCKHHSIYFGTIFEPDKSSYQWNCCLDNNPTHRNLPKLVTLPSFRGDYRQNNCPFIYE
ncbi:MAG: hypothetical protein ACFE88_17035 [Candidatus Hermodarchaeota archaeon]